MNLDLFFIGAPQDNEYFPQSQEDKLFLEQFFSFPESNFSVDYRVEAMPHKNCIYYTYMKHKNIFGTRQGSYFAITLKISQGYCTDIYGIYSILDSAYRNLCIDKILSHSGQGVKYQVRSLAEVDNIRIKIEQYITTALNTRFYPLLSFDNSFSHNRSKPQLNTVSVGIYSNQQLLAELKEAHTLHLISENDMAKVNEGSKQNLISQYEAALNNKDETILTLQKEINNAKNQIDNNFKNHKNERNTDPIDQRWNKIQNDISEIKHSISDLKQANHHKSKTHKRQPPLHENTENQQVNTSRSIKNNTTLPWLLLALAVVGIILLILLPKITNNKAKNTTAQYTQQIENLQKENDYLKNKIEELNKINSGLSEKLNGIKNTVGENNNKPAPNQPHIDIAQFNKNKKEAKVGDTLTVTILDTNNKPLNDIQWEITNGSDCASKETTNQLKCNKPGQVTLSVKTSNGEKIERTIKIIQ